MFTEAAIDECVAVVERAGLGFRALREDLDREIKAALAINEDLDKGKSWARSAREQLDALNRDILTQRQTAAQAESKARANVAAAEAMVTRCSSMAEALSRLLDATRALAPLAAEPLVSERPSRAA